MKKIAIITITDMSNLGNRLQNYALQKVLNSKGFYSETILKYPHCDENNITYILKKRFLNSMKFVLRFFPENKRQRQYNFYRFNKRIKFSNINMHKNMNYERILNRYDYFICGSDQIWNPNLLVCGKDISFNFLYFVPDKKKVAYAPSFGVSELTHEQAAQIKKFLSEFSQISVREQAGAEIIWGLTKKESIVTLDPTLLLPRYEWEQVERKPKDEPKKDYILIYFLGKITSEYEQLIINLKNKYNLDIVNLLDKKTQYYAAGPSEFIYYIHHAKIILTDSFHASVFSIIFEKPFIVLKREDQKYDMNSRLDNLINILQLKGHEYEPGMDLDKIMRYDFSKTRHAIEREKNKSLDFLFSALSQEQ